MTILTETAETVLQRRYYLEGEDWSGLCARVARTVAAAEDERGRVEYEEQFYNAIHDLDFLPNSPCLMNAGTDLGQLSACFVLPIDDTLDSIFSAVKNGALVNKTGGGTGYSFSKLRPKNSAVCSTNGVASGPVSFAQVFDAATDVIKQGGRRRGANMGVLDVSHPDIKEFIACKQDRNLLTNFNLSVAITDDFMNAVNGDENYALVDPSTGETTQEVPAREVFDLIVSSAWENGEPGVFFIDAANRANPTPWLGKILGTNPCWSGDTMVWTADGPQRFDALAESGKDVLVLTQDDEGHLFYSTMRSPRITAESAPLVKITFDNGTSVTCTPNHKLYLRSGGTILASELKQGDSISSLYRHKANSKGYLKLTNGIESVVEHHVLGYARIAAQVGCSKHLVRKRLQEACQPVNHKVASVEYIEGTVPVYNGTVDGTHRYFVHCGENDAILSANCGEIPLLPYEACVLGSINLGRFVNNRSIDYSRLRYMVRLATRFLDNTIDVSKYPIPEITAMVRKTRKLGLGIMGLHDMLIKMEFPYASEEGRELAANVMQIVHEEALKTSEELANEKGVCPVFDEHTRPYRRNAALTSIQPTGTVSMIANCSSGCEPYFALVNRKNVMDNDSFIMVNPLFEEAAKNGGWYSNELMERVAERGTVVGDPDVPEKWQRIFMCAQDISVEDHILMQATLQTNGVDAAISKTINMPITATKEDVRRAYLKGWTLGCKGLTVYRDGCRTGQVLTVGTKQDGAEQETTSHPFEPIRSGKMELPDVLESKRYRLKDKNGQTIYIIICFTGDGYPVEVFAKFPYDNRIEQQEQSTMWATTCRMVSLALRCGIDIGEVIKQLDRASGHMRDLPAQLSKLLKTFMSTQHGYDAGSCPDCGVGKLVFQEGCMVCASCGYSKCS